MKNIIKTTGLAAFALAFVGSTLAQDNVAGKWKAQFDSQLGQQTYTYTFNVDGTNLTGRAVGIRDNATNDVAIAEVKIDKDKISFVEPLKMQDNDVRIEYSGTVSGDEIKLHRKVGDFAEYDIVAKRVKEGGTDAVATPATNSPLAKP
jgi:hypothetical protein